MVCLPAECFFFYVFAFFCAYAVYVVQAVQIATVPLALGYCFLVNQVTHWLREECPNTDQK